MRAFPPFDQRRRRSERQTATTVEKGHGRLERRTLVSTSALAEHLDWPGAQQAIQVTRERTVRGKKTTDVAYYVTSLPRERVDAAQMQHLIRRHWGAIENGLHWVRDESLGEDRSTIRKEHAPQNWAALRNGSLNWLRRHGHGKITATLRSFNRHPARLFTKLGLVK